MTPGMLLRSQPRALGPSTGRAGRPRQGRRTMRPLASAGSGLLTLPVLPMPSVLHPTAQRTVRVFEPEYLRLFDHLLEVHPGGAGAHFLHVLHPSAAPPALLDEAGTVAGLPRVGCCAEVHAVRRLAGGELQVDYSGGRRARLLSLEQEEPFKVAAAEWYDDWSVTESEVPVEELEGQLMALLQQVCNLTAALDPMGGTMGLLPEAVQRFAPVAPQQRLTSYDALKVSAPRAASAIDMWRRHGSVYDKGPAQRQGRQSDPYAVVRELLSAHERREFLSFAAAQMLELGLPERLALLLSRDTGARLQYVMAAVEPHLQRLQAQAAVKRALGSYDGGE